MPGIVFADEQTQTAIVVGAVLVLCLVFGLLQWDYMRADAEQRQRDADAEQARVAGVLLANRRRRGGEE